MSILVFAVALVSITASHLHAADCGGPIPCGCGDKVIQNYQMTEDIGPCTSHGLLIADGVTLDGNGHRLIGPGGTTEVYGVYLNGTVGATVKNVVVTHFLRGIRLRNARHNRLLNNETFQNGDFRAHVGYGIDVANGATDNFFEGNLIYNNADEGIHFGSGSGSNTFVGNRVYDNHVENIYFVASHDNIVTGNTTWGGRASVYLKDSSGTVLQDNVFRDGIVHLRANSYENEFINNDLLGTGMHFQVYTEQTPFRYPRNNLVRGGRITNANGTCVRFSSSWGNEFIDTILASCRVDVVSDGSQAPAHNTFTSVSFNASKIEFDSNSSLDVGWFLDVHVQNEQATSVTDARVRAFDRAGRLIFDVLTDLMGDIETQEVFEYTQTAFNQTLYTPIVVETSAANYQSNSQQIALTVDTAVTVTLQPGGVTNSPPTVSAGPDSTITLPESASLRGAVTDDGRPDPPGRLTTKWSKVSGPGNVDFADPSAVLTTATFSAEGTYILRLEVNDGELDASDTLVVTAVTSETLPGERDVTDTFTRPDSSVLGQGWMEVVGDLEIREQELKSTPLKGYNIAVLPGLHGANQRVAADFASVANGTRPRFGVILRFQDPQHYYLLYRQAGEGRWLRIAKVVEGEETILAATRLDRPEHDRFFRLEGRAQGATLTLVLDGEELLSCTDPDATFSDGTLGILLGSMSVNYFHRADNFSASAF